MDEKELKMNEWIKVSDKLPEENKDVLVYDSEVGICIAWLDDEDWYALGLNYVDVTHWMPLPEIPEEVKE